MMIFKVQRPLGGDMSLALVYDRDRSREWFVPYADVAPLFERLGNPPKVYVEAEIVEGVFTAINVVPSQNW